MKKLPLLPINLHSRKAITTGHECVPLPGNFSLWVERNAILELGTVYSGRGDDEATSCEYRIERHRYNDGKYGIVFRVDGAVCHADTIKKARQLAIERCRRRIARESHRQQTRNAIRKLVNHLADL